MMNEEARVPTHASFMGLDSPASTSAQTYKVQYIANDGGYPFVMNSTPDDSSSTNYSRGVCSITAIEIGA